MRKKRFIFVYFKHLYQDCHRVIFLKYEFEVTKYFKQNWYHLPYSLCSKFHIFRYIFSWQIIPYTLHINISNFIEYRISPCDIFNVTLYIFLLLHRTCCYNYCFYSNSCKYIHFKTLIIHINT